MSQPQEGLSPTGSDGASTSRRRFATLCLTSLVATAGCLGPFGDDTNGNGDDSDDSDDFDTDGNDDSDDSDDSDDFDIVPESIDGVLFVENRVVEDESARVVMAGVVNAGTGVADEGGRISEYRQLLVELEESDVDHDHSTLFYRNDGPEYTALVVETDDDQDAALDLVRDRFDEVEETSDGDVEVFVGERDGVTGWLVPLGNESLIVGTEPAVQDSLDVYRGDADPFGGELRAAHDRASDGELKATMALEDDEFDEIAAEISPEFAGVLGLLPDPELLTVTYQYVDGEEVLFDLQLTMESEGDAEQFHGMAELVIEDENGLPVGDTIDDELLESLSVERTDRYVTLTLSTTAEELASYFE